MPNMPRVPDVLSDLTAAREYLHEMASACAEGATADDPRVTLLALGVLARAGSELEAARQ